MFTIFGSLVWGIIILITLILIFTYSELEEVGHLAFVAFLIFLGINYYWGNLDIKKYLNFYYLGSYLLIGFIYSIIKVVYLGKSLNSDEKRYFHLKDHILRWILMWWISLIVWLFSGLLQDVWSKIWKKIEKFYNYLFNL